MTPPRALLPPAGVTPWPDKSPAPSRESLLILENHRLREENARLWREVEAMRQEVRELRWRKR